LYCEFYASFGEAVNALQPPEHPIVAFRTNSSAMSYTYNGNYSNFEEMKEWVQLRCIPLVRELTLENAEKLTENLRSLILIYETGDLKTVEDFKAIVKSELIGEKSE
jgi:Thioredoxin-like domain